VTHSAKPQTKSSFKLSALALAISAATMGLAVQNVNAAVYTNEADLTGDAGTTTGISEPGAAGTVGDSGTPGATGATGLTGASGADGTTAGASGADATPGSVGATGNKASGGLTGGAGQAGTNPSGDATSGMVGYATLLVAGDKLTNSGTITAGVGGAGAAGYVGGAGGAGGAGAAGAGAGGSSSPKAATRASARSLATLRSSSAIIGSARCLAAHRIEERRGQEEQKVAILFTHHTTTKSLSLAIYFD